MSGVDEAALSWARTVLDRQVAHLSRLVDDLLDVSRIAIGKITLQREPVEIAQVVTAAVESSQPLIDSREHTLEVLLPDEPLRIEGDVTRLSQVVLNLLNNAAKFTPKGGHIRLEVEREEAMAAIRVQDTGIGIPADLLPNGLRPVHAGGPLARPVGGRSRHRPHPGAAAGEAARRLGRGPERGSRSRQRVRRPSAAARRPPLARPAGRQGGREPAGAASTACSWWTTTGMPRRPWRLLLQLWGHEVRSALDGSEALSLAAEFRPGIILLDIGLPGMSGYEVARQLRNLPGVRDVFIVAVTGYGQESDRLQSQEAGFDHHLVKPVQPEVLRELIASAPVVHGGC